MLPSRSAPSTLHLALVLGTLTAFGPLSIDLYLPGLPGIARDLQASDALIQSTLATFVAGMALGQLIHGPLSDRLGRRLPLLIGSIIYTLASAACAMAPDATTLVVLRFVQALGGSAGVVVSRSVVRDLFGARESARMFSILMLVTGLAPITAPLIGGQILEVADWRALFWVLTGFGVVTMVLVLGMLPETLPDERRIVRAPLDVLRGYGEIARDRQFVGMALTGAGAFAAMFAYISASPFVFIELYGVTPSSYGWIFGGNALGLVLAAQLNRHLLRRSRPEAILRAGLGLSAVAALVFLGVLWLRPGDLPPLLPPLFVVVAMVGIAGPNTTAIALGAYATRAGSASALLGTLQFVVGAIAAALVGVLADGTGRPMGLVMAGAAAFALLCFLVTARPAPPAAT
ncbi:MAG: Bcr/CflA family multidrug efflux MFS transporter [Chloroflexi bacterium]|nr:Bcr/CflA family multidrug efflux MFS transporter [Chloroflexota bacterium]